jgi:hypothetical protein|tara:strand:- start:407 stop:571 length:165 start_codon:yes stop_codon:yes gene_type:complete
MGTSTIVIRVDYDFYKSYILKLKEIENERGNVPCSDKTATSILKKRLDAVGGLA